MSESDDTDILLLIPPDYYCKDTISAAEKRFEQLQQLKMNEADALAMPPPPAPLASSTTAAYKYLPPSKKTELNEINSRLQNIDIHVDEFNCPFDAPSDISTISTNTARTQLTATNTKKKTRDINGLVHSTPKSAAHLDEAYSAVTTRRNVGATAVDDGILHEIDNYLDENNRFNDYNWQRHHHSDEYRRRDQPTNYIGQEPQAAISLPSALNRQTTAVAIKSTKDTKLISLSEIWGTSGQATVTASSSSTHPSLKEEQLRRQHLEKTVHTLQTQLLEYQQRISVAIEVDRTKDAALQAAQQENKTLNYEVQHLRDSLHKYEAERHDFNSRMDAMQHELAQAVSLATKFQEKNERLEMELTTYMRKASESCNQHKEQLEALELKVHGCKRAEECANNELQKLKDRYAKVEYQSDKLKTRNEELEKENTTLKHQKEMLQDYHSKQKTRADNLETQRKSLQETLASLTENETMLKNKIETQQKALKSHYQQQLENVVTKKLVEFQEQLDRNSESLKAEAREREHIIADRAVKQLELINEKNEIEVNLLQQKHHEEVELYRLQIANASKKIEELELKLKCYKSKRADIAEKLHDVMETQWQKALEILISPNQTVQSIATADSESESPEQNTQQTTPKTNRTQRSTVSNSTEKNNLDTGAKRLPTSPMDKLQAYIELLLSKSPSDLDKLEEILALSSKSKATTTKSSKRNSKPPWKT